MSFVLIAGIRRRLMKRFGNLRAMMLQPLNSLKVAKSSPKRRKRRRQK